jgi:hypothetical protein
MRKLFLLVAFILSCSGGWAQVAAANPNANLRAWYKCVGDSSATAALPSSGTTVYDSSGFGNTGTYTGTKAGSSASTYYSTGGVGPYACYFDGSTNYVTLATTATSALNFGTGSYTVSFVMNPTTIPASAYVVPLYFQTSGNTSQIFCQLKYSDATSYLFCLTQDSNGINGGGINTNLGLFAAGHPYMITMTMNRATNIFSLYINGVFISSETVAMTGNVNWSQATAHPCIGGNGCTSSKFNGTINDVRVYNTALTNWQVAQLYAGNQAQNATPQIAGQLASLSVSGTSAYVVPTDFMGWSIETSYAGPVMGQSSTGTDLIIRQMATNLTNVSGGNLYIRVGGSTTDSTSTAYSFEPEVEFLAAKPSSEFSMGVCAKTCSLVQQEAEAAAYVGAMSSVALEFGNEPDSYSISSATYTTDLTNFLSPVHTSFPSTKFVGASCSVYFCTAMALLPPAVFTAGASYGLTTGTVHSYAYPSCSATNCLLQPAAYLPSQPTYLAQYAANAHGSGYKYRVNEMNNIAGGGGNGESNTFSSALWLIANAMTMAQNTVDGINIHGGYTGGSGSYYDPFQITITAGTPNTFSIADIQPIYYGMLFFDTATQNNAAIYPVTVTQNAACSQSGWQACTQAWETKDTGGVYRLSLVNLDQVNSGNVVVSNAASTASVCYLSAPSWSSQTGITFAGQTFDGSTTGTIQGTASYTTLTPSGGVFTIPMAVTQAAIVRFGASTGC